MTGYDAAYDVPVAHLRRWKLGHCDRYGRLTAAGALAAAEAGERHWRDRARFALVNDPAIRQRQSDLLRDWLRRRRFWRTRARAIRAEMAAKE